MCKVRINNHQYNIPKGKLLSEFLIDNGFSVAHTCGGRGVCGKCKVTVNGESVLSCGYVINNDITVELPINSDVESVTGAEESNRLSQKMCYALDIGTTTIALALVSLDNKEIINVATCTNPQVTFGADVISRIDYCRQNSVDKLQNAVADGVNNLIKRLGSVYCDEMYVSGNTTMLHLLFGKNPCSMGVAPYTPQFLESQTAKGENIGLICTENVISLPCIASFVGADLVSGMNYVGMPSKDKYNLLVDLGSNAEIVLFSENSVLCTSAAAGPCFEGANITCGMSATKGAVYSFEYKENDNILKTISGVAPEGICGTGLVDIISELVKNGIIDETGYMECENYKITDNVYLSQGDVRQYQLAKSAVYSAIITLLKIQKIEFSQVENMYISGGFSAKINIDNAVKTGLLPKELKEKALPINNSSLLGTVKYIIEKNNLQKYLKNARYIDLSMNTEFSELFINNMEF